jgi:hypothetical protein
MLREIAEAAGLDAALRLAEVKGGQKIYVPSKTMSDHHWLVRAVGRPAAEAVARLYGGEYIDLPANPAGGLNGMRRRAEAALDEGVSINEAVRRSGFTRRALFMRKAKRAERKPEPDLFARKK